MAKLPHPVDAPELTAFLNSLLSQKALELGKWSSINMRVYPIGEGAFVVRDIRVLAWIDGGD